MDLRTLDELRDERMQKDLEQSLQKRRKVEIKESSLIKNNKKDSENNEELHDFDEVLRGDFMPSYLDPRHLESGRDIHRSQAPEPSQKIYLIRSQSHITRWKLHVDINKNKNQLRLRRIANRFLKNKRKGSVQRAVNISIDGRKCL
ncbi:hypothetical protein HN011_011752 [Eciton burchellii]|nr:hypothetical protein HN011_011752 [Eciton burchellii]